MNDIETMLRTSGRQTLDLPAAEILRRGDRMRRRRRTAQVVAAVAAFSVAGVMAYVAIPDRLIDSDIATQTPSEKNPVGWSGEPTNLTLEELDEMSERCLTSAWRDLESEYESSLTAVPLADNLHNPDDIEQIPAGTWPFLAEKRGSTAKAIFKGVDYSVTCSTPTDPRQSAGSEPDLTVAAGTPEFWGSLASMGPWEDFSRSTADDVSEFTLPLPEELNVTKVVFTSNGEEIPATIVNGVAVAWIDHEVSVDSASFRAYDADGELVHGEAPAPPTTEWTETAEGIRVTRSLSNETVESAWFWVGEQRFDATITKDNVAVALIPTGTLTADQLDKLQIQGLSPDGLYLMGCNGGPCGP
ncbi:hypothetical protein ACIRON_12790 [Nocardioides sp. NPDC101246]|uniref:hypothetical protein n=1 Tax=Nocardioides sp. NPDC101246 TaxID=3364336 RepID=UPI00380A6818